MSYTVSSVRETGTIRYHCPTTSSALEKVHDFQRADYREITIATADEQIISENQLASLAVEALLDAAAT